jgi:hypothetical protein
MKRLVVLTIAAMLMGTTSLADGSGSGSSCRRFCLSVSPSEGEVGQVFFIRGHGWLPNRLVRATFGQPCFSTDPKTPCIASARVKRFHTSRRGGFLFVFENGPGSCKLQGVGVPGGVGRGPVNFRQFGKQAGRKVVVERVARLTVDSR